MAEDNMKAELTIVGGGPAGLAAAIEAAKHGVQVSVFDENGQPGGQLFKQIHKFFGSQEHQAGARGYDIGGSLLSQCKELGVNMKLGTVVWGAQNGCLGVHDGARSYTVEATKTIVATGAAEKSLLFPGWTLPGVMGAGAAQTMVNVHRVLPGRKVVVVGSGNVGLIVSYQLLLAGAEVVAVVEALPKIGGYQVHAAKIKRAGVPILTSTTICEARGDREVEAAVVVSLDKQGNPILGTERVLDVDLVCVAVGLRPLSEICRMAGCKHRFVSALGGYVPYHDESMETSVRGIYVAGDVSGVEEASTAMEEGRLAALSVVEQLGYLRPAEAAERKKLVRESLSSLRLGPFGAMRAEAKGSLMRSGVIM